MDFINLDKHTVVCPHCGKQVLDHMTQCPFCKGTLTPGGRKPLDQEKLKRIKRILSIAGYLLAAVVIAWVLLTR